MMRFGSNTMVDWQVTAATLLCKEVNGEVTLLVYKDWSVKCTGYSKYSVTGKATKRNSHSPACQGTECELATEYRKKLQAEEVGK